ncbi:hypothetical protein [Flavobacterium sp.]|uniref:hypothetical protein n=1 Tax=Flavobacterium sp. TaxID=239 RepID=UPI0037AE3FC4
MKKIILFLALSLCCNTIYSQKKKIKEKQSSSVLAKSDNITAEVIKNNFYLFIANKGAEKETILLKSIEGNKLPTECKIIPFTTKGVKLYSVSWTENKVTETKLKTEDMTTTYTEICDVTTKTKLLSNAQTINKIKEIHFLDANKNASETIQRVRNEGLILSLTKDGDVILKGKTQENKLTYNPTEAKFVNVSSSGEPKKKK